MQFWNQVIPSRIAVAGDMREHMASGLGLGGNRNNGPSWFDLDNRQWTMNLDTRKVEDSCGIDDQS